MTDLRNHEQALAYALDCTLATVEKMSVQKKRVKYEYQRQIRIAQKLYTYCRAYEVDIEHTRGADVASHRGNVANWAKAQEQEFAA